MAETATAVDTKRATRPFAINEYILLSVLARFGTLNGADAGRRAAECGWLMSRGGINMALKQLVGAGLATRSDVATKIGHAAEHTITKAGEWAVLLLNRKLDKLRGPGE